MVDAFVGERARVIHNEHLGLPLARNSFRIRRHPKVQLALGIIKHLKKKQPLRLGQGGNPKFHYLNKERVRLQKLGLSKQDFDERVSDAVQVYEADGAVRQAARDSWQRHRQNLRLLDLKRLQPTSNWNLELPDASKYGLWGDARFCLASG